MSSRRKHSQSAWLIGLTFVILTEAAASPLFISFDEWGKAFMCDATRSSAMIPLCSVNRINQMGTFARIHSGFTFDPTVGGGTQVLDYILPFDAGNVDVVMKAPDETTPEDLIRFIGKNMFFYSLKHGSGDGLAEVAALPPIRAEFATTIKEIGPEGDNHGLYFGHLNGELAEYIPHSDELAACPPRLVALHACGPLNVAPPPSNPTRDITGFAGPIVQVMLPTANAFDPIATNVPEPRSVWVLGTVFSICCWKQYHGRRKANEQNRFPA